MHTTGHAATVGKTLLFGAASAALYGLLYLYADALAAFCSQGGVSASLPIGIALLFSYVHGSFAANLWRLFGVTAHTTPAPAPLCPEEEEPPLSLRTPAHA